MAVRLTPKQQEAYDQIRKVRRVGYWLTALNEIGAHSLSVQALVRKGLVMKKGRYYYASDNMPNSIGDYDVWSDGFSLER